MCEKIGMMGTRLMVMTVQVHVRMSYVEMGLSRQHYEKCVMMEIQTLKMVVSSVNQNTVEMELFKQLCEKSVMIKIR